MINDLRPEQLYKTATDPVERRRLQAAVLAEYRDNVKAYVARAVPPEHRAEGLQVGLLGLLVALETYDALPDDGRGKKQFWGWAEFAVRDEVRNWLGQAVYWRKSPNRGKSPARQAAATAARAHMTHASVDAVDERTGLSMHDALRAPTPTAEEIVAELEAAGRLAMFLDSLLPSERKAALSPTSRHHCSIVERARAFVRGQEDGDDQTRPGDALLCNGAATRP